MYSLVLILHSWLRWIAIAAGVGATAAAASGPPGRSGSERPGLLFMISMDLQMLLGLLLYAFLSPNTAAVFKDFGAAMKDPVARFWAVEHVTMMLAAVVLAHVGRVLGRKASTPGKKRTRLLISFGLSTLLMIAGTPWPGMRAGRPLFRV
jgi:hypothetical protein